MIWQNGFCQIGQPQWNVLSRVGRGGTSIMLRWMPPTASSWNSGVSSGYLITRYTHTSTGAISTTVIVPAGATTTNPSVPKILGADSTSSKWSNFWKNDSTTYKYLFYLTINKLIPNNNLNTPGGGVAALSNLEERFFYANVLADSKFKAAALCGLGYTDNTVVPGTKYSYVIKNLATGETSPNTGIITASYTTLPDIPINFTSEFKRLKINWGSANLWDYYSGYYIEKSINGGSTYSRLNDIPYVDLSDSTNFMVFSDSIPNANASYRYRAVGISYFDELRNGTPKDTTIIKIQEFSPGINRVKSQGSNFKIDWKYPYSNPKKLAVNTSSDISSYTIGVSRTDNAKLGSPNFKTIASNVSRLDTTFQFPKSTINSLIGDTLTNKSIYYYYIISYGIGGAGGVGKDTVYSSPYAVKPVIIDNVPPSTPTLGQVAKPTAISTSNKLMIKISWNKSTDNNGVLGYRVFRTIGTDLEKIEVSGGIVTNLDGPARAYTNDTISQNLDYKIIKYYVSAFDSSYNESNVLNFSYAQPDKRRPMPATFKSAALVTSGSNTNSVQLVFKQSPSKRSENIIHEIFRKDDSPGQNWSKIKTIAITASDTSYIDATTLAGKVYAYSILAKDDSLNYSCDSIPSLSGTINPLPSYCYPIITINTLIHSLKPALTTLTQTYSETSKAITLNWTYAQPNIVGYEIYRGTVKTGIITKPAFLDYAPSASILSYVDSKIDFDSTYAYRVRANFTDGSVSAWKDVQTALIKQSKLSVNYYALSFERAANSQPIVITSNIAWTATSNATWLTTSVSTGSNNLTINLNATANTTASIRKAIVTITGAGLTSTIDIEQFAPPTGTGITAKYYNFTSLNDIQTREPNIVRIESQINIGAGGSPLNGVFADYVAVWEGEIEVPNNGDYTFYVSADDGAILYFNDKKIITSNFNEVASPIQTLSAGQKYPIRLEYWDASSWSGITLKWSSNVGLSKQLISVPYLYPKSVPSANDADPLHNKCFVMRNTATDKTFQTPGDYTFRELPFISKNYQKWKFVKNGTFYNIISQIDNQNKSLQVINDGNKVNDKLTIGYLGNKASEKWTVTNPFGNTYNIQRSASALYLGSAWDEYPRLLNGRQNITLEPTECPNYNTGILLDTDELTFDYKQQAKSIVLKSEVEWSSVNFNDWISLSPSYGLQNTTISVILGKNPNMSPRSGIIGFKSNNGTINVKISQEAAPCIEVSNAVTGCGTKSVEGITINNSNNFAAGIYEFNIDNVGTWKQYTWQINNLTNGNHTIYVRKISDSNCTGSLPFSISCY